MEDINMQQELQQEVVQKVINIEQLRMAQAELQLYKSGKAHLDAKLIDNEDWWKLAHYRNFKTDPTYVKDPETGTVTRVHDKKWDKKQSAWLFNSIMNKHADAMDNYPEPAILPREMTDIETAKVLSSILPVVLENDDYEQTYSDAWWDKLVSGAAIYAVTWDSEKLNGLGDISIDQVDILNFYWEPGVQDIQDSRNIFSISLVDNDILEQNYPQLKGKLIGNGIDVKQYNYDDSVDTSKKSVVVDWYYKTQIGTKTTLQYVKFVNDELLYSSEDDEQHPEYREQGYYMHGKYPFVVDVLFREKGTPAGFGYVDIMRAPQEYIDELGADLLTNAKWKARPRFFARDDMGINQKEFQDEDQQIVHVAGSLDDQHMKQITVDDVSSNYINIWQLKVDELKETSGNRDFSQGSTTSGVTAASAIAALQEAGSKGSRDMIKGAYRAYTEICQLVIELMRQFYDLPRVFRITGDTGEMQFAQFDNSQLQMRPQEVMGQIFQSMPEFDISVKAQKANPYSKLSQNELALQFYQLGFFNPQQAQQALATIDMMDFEGKDKVKETIQKNDQTQQVLIQMAQIIAETTGDQRLLQQFTGQPITEPPAGKAEMPEANSLGETQKEDTSTAGKAMKKSREATEVK